MCETRRLAADDQWYEMTTKLYVRNGRARSP